MGNVKIEPDELENALLLILEDFENEVEEDLRKDITKSADVIVKELKRANPPGAGRYHDWEAYNEGWTRTTEKDGFNFKVVVHNAEKPGLTHLLEKGHLTRDGHSMAKTFPHIAPAAEYGMKDLERRLNNGS